MENDITIFIVLAGFMSILTIGALLGEVAVWVAKILGYEFIDNQVNVDFIQRLQDGEVLDAENMFSNGE